MNIKKWLGESNSLGIDIWEKKYKHEEETFTEWLERVSNGDPELRDMILNKEFIFAGRILANRGLHKLGRKVTYSNCYVMVPPEDNIESIFDTAKNLARTYSYGGGCGVDISKLRPRGALVNNTAKETSGAVSFMDLYDLTTSLIGQNGRRGALMISIDVNHPDVEEFLSVKSDLKKINKANISVRICNNFMKAVEGDEDYDLYYRVEATGEEVVKTIRAKHLFMKLVEQNWEFAEPGALFWDRIKEYNLLQHDKEFEFAGTNPCAEEPLPAGGSCLLGSIILPTFVDEDGKFNSHRFAVTVRNSVKALNDVLDEGLPLHPLPEQRDSVHSWRQIGLGVMGVGDMLIKMGIRYDTQKALDVCNEIGHILAREALTASAFLAKEFGMYPKCKTDTILESDFFKEHADEKLTELVKEYGLRNSQLLTIAPTGSIGTQLQVSTGVEPNFAFSYTRKTESLHGQDVYYRVFTKIVEDYMTEHRLESELDLPEFFVSAQNIDPIMRVKMQSVWQKHIDASISSTVNLPHHATKEDVYRIYMEAWKHGLKGVTVYRDGCARSGILTLSGPAPEDGLELKRGEIKKVAEDTAYYKKPLNIGCGTLKLFIGYSPKEKAIQDLYVVKAGEGGCEKNIQALAIFMSGILRLGGNLFTLEKAIRGVSGCSSFAAARANGRVLTKGSTCSSAILNILKDFEKEMDMIPDQKSENAEKMKQHVVEVKKEDKSYCPECGEPLQFSGGCGTCLACGYSKCF